MKPDIFANLTSDVKFAKISGFSYSEPIGSDEVCKIEIYFTGD